MKPFPGGITHLLPANAETDWWSALLSPTPNASNRSLTRDYVDNFRARSGWKYLETSARNYNWTNIDNALALIAGNGKRCTISISAGVNIPDRVKALVPAAHLLSVHTDATHTDTMAVMWDGIFQTELGNFIADFAAKYDANPTIACVFLTGFMQDVEAHVSSVDTDQTLFENAALADGYVDRGDGDGAKSVAYRAGVGVILDLWFNAFQQTPIYFTSSRPWGQTQAGTDDQNWVESTLSTRYGDRRGLCNSFLKARANHTGGVPTPVTYGRSAQAIFSTVDVRFYSDKSGPPWVPPAPTPVEDLLIEGYLANRQNVEVYEYDMDGGIAPNPLPSPDPEINAAVMRAQRINLLSLVPIPGGGGSGTAPGKTPQTGRKALLVR